jgi:UDP-GlcNAc3NAcA epimerase
VKRIVSVVGARPQFVKAAVVSRALRDAGGAQEKLLHTGQHYDQEMSEVFFQELGIAAPDHHLGIHGGSHGEMTGRMLAGIEGVLVAERPDLVVVYGDTNSTLAGALAAAKLNIPVAHVEAGLRSGNLRMPEEINRIVADRVSHWLLCPTAVAERNLRKEGVEPGRIHVVGDVMYDAVLHYARNARAPSTEVKGPYCVATVHRAENADDPRRLGSILQALERISEATPVILPLHPRTLKRMQEFGLEVRRVRIIEPLGYLGMIGLVRGAEGVLTDSGGLQKEAYFLRKPCITLRSETEWTELVDLGVNIIAGVESEAILGGWQMLRGRQLDWSARPYGDGNAGERIAATLLSA